MRLTSVDLPTLGRPTTASTGCGGRRGPVSCSLTRSPRWAARRWVDERDPQLLGRAARRYVRARGSPVDLDARPARPNTTRDRGAQPRAPRAPRGQAAAVPMHRDRHHRRARCAGPGRPGRRRPARAARCPACPRGTRRARRRPARHREAGAQRRRGRPAAVHRDQPEPAAAPARPGRRRSRTWRAARPAGAQTRNTSGPSTKPLWLPASSTGPAAGHVLGAAHVAAGTAPRASAAARPRRHAGDDARPGPAGGAGGGRRHAGRRSPAARRPRPARARRRRPAAASRCAGVEVHRVVGGPQRAGRTAAVEPVAAGQVGRDRVDRGPAPVAADAGVGVAGPAARPGRPGRRRGRPSPAPRATTAVPMSRPSATAPAAARQPALQRDQAGAHRGHGADGADRGGHLGAADAPVTSSPSSRTAGASGSVADVDRAAATRRRGGDRRRRRRRSCPARSTASVAAR